MKKKTEFDVIIVGGGLSGLVLAIALARLPLKIAVIDSKKNDTTEDFAKPTSIKELRALALSYASQKIFQNLNLWNALTPYAYPIKHVHVSDRGHFGFVRMHALEYCLENFGSVISMQSLLQVLQKKTQEFSNLYLYYDAHLLNIDTDQKQNNLTVQVGKDVIALQSKLTVAADGTHSKLRELLNIKTNISHYKQTAIVANVGVERVHDETAYERFTKNGPLALLPVSENAFSVVWTQAPADVETVFKMSDKDFLQQLQRDFGYRLGRFTWVGERQSFPLSLLKSEKIIAERTLIIGNAAHTLHPIAGQGFNLGLRDIAVLVELVEQTLNENKDFGTRINLAQFEMRRKKDINSVIKMTDGLVKIFSNNLWPHSFIRNLALLGLDLLPIKKNLARQAMGIYQYMPKLAIES